jgi:hypothetical protein
MPTDPRDDLKRLEPYLQDIDLAVRSFGRPLELDAEVRVDVPLVCAVALRETWAGWAPSYYPKGEPDGYGDDPDGERGPRAAFGRGLFQIDTRGPYRKFIPPRGTSWPVFDQARAATTALRDAWSELRSFRSHPLFARACVAVYNAGSPAVARMLRTGNDPDVVTAPGPSRRPDYGADVLARRVALLSKYPHVFAPAGADRRIA